MALLQTDFAKGLIGMAWPMGAGLVAAKRVPISLPNTIALNDIAEMAILPAGFRVVDMILDSDDLDSNVSPAITLDVGFMSGEAGKYDLTRTCGKEFFDASTVAQAGGVVRPTLKGAFRTATSNVARGIGVKVSAAAATKVAGVVGLTLIYANGD